MDNPQFNFSASHENCSLRINLINGLIAEASMSPNCESFDLFCLTIKGMDLSNAAYYGAKITLENNTKPTESGIGFVENNNEYNICNILIRKIFNDSNEPEIGRFENSSLKNWQNTENAEKYEIISKTITNYFHGNSLFKLENTLVSIKNNTINLNLSNCIPKNKQQITLVKLERFIRDNLNGAPIIVLIEEFEDANTKRK